MTKNPFDSIFEEIAKLMKLAYENVDKPAPYEKEMELHKKLDELEKQVKSFETQNEKLLGEMGYSDFKISSIIKDPEELKKFDPDQKKIIEKAENLKNEASTAAEDIEKAKIDAAAKKKETTPQKPVSSQARKRKFRGMGGDEMWKKL